ncbi:phosphatase PAP2 family protein [Hymenobacter properus]|uniref:Phosphatase PAP2 family protein n=1 Tax=Hymenobacter properus TaxID=2791026 RepID=A0A931FL28_9BACT|nr:phosphatase PAP2 family protein [Hymenobacter properus]MBF9144537.1 phosphatase PAP2 family protein [Hymenobacter properus]MBR7723355.1 phosphatase PAP2 family protein [Microvirga sp. SRT04]
MLIRISQLFALLLAHKRRLLWLLLLGVVLPWGIFLKASSEIEEGEGFYGDLQLLRWAHAHTTPALDSFFLFCSAIGGPVPMTVAAVLFTGVLVWRRQPRYAWFFGLAVGGAAALNLLAKAILGRPRPAFWVSLAPETSFSFPSGHAMGSAAVVLALGLLLARGRWRVWLPGALFVLAVGFSRVYLGVHYPSDVLSG